VNSAARFASPEQIGGAKVDVRSEIYSLGVTMWFLLTGVPPVSDPKVSGENAARIARDKLRGVPKIVRHLLDRMLRANPAERPQDPVALAAYLQTCLARVERRAKIERRFGLPVAAKLRVVEPKVRMPIPIKPLALAAGLLALAALGGLVLLGGGAAVTNILPGPSPPPTPARRGSRSNIRPIHSTRHHVAHSSRCGPIITAIFSRRLSLAPQRAWWTESVRACPSTFVPAHNPVCTLFAGSVQRRGDGCS